MVLNILLLQVGSIPKVDFAQLTQHLHLFRRPEGSVLLILPFQLTLLRAERPAQQVEGLQEARFAAAVRADEDREPFQRDGHVPQTLEVLDRDLPNHG